MTGNKSERWTLVPGGSSFPNFAPNPPFFEFSTKAMIEAGMLGSMLLNYVSASICLSKRNA